MKNFSKIVGLTLALSALVLAGCKKKPMRGLETATPMGPATDTGATSTIDPNAVSVPADANPGLTGRDANAGKPDESGKSVVDAIYFQLDRFAVAAPERPKLEAAVKWLKDNPDQNLVMTGHCDWRGTKEYNLGLGDRRANAVKRYLETLGADPKRLETLSKGSEDAKQSGTEADWKNDRRVDFVLLKR